MDLVESAEREVKHLDASYHGRLMISANSGIADTLLVDAIKAYKEVDPDFTYKIIVESLYNYKDSIGMDFDIYLREGDLRDSRVKSRKVIDSSYAFYASPDYLSAHDMPDSLEELYQNHTFVSFWVNNMNFWTKWINQEKLQTGQPSAVISNDGHVVIASAEEGLGIAVLPYYLAKRPLERGTLVKLDYEFEFPSLPLYALFHSSTTLGEPGRQFLEFLLEHTRTHFQ
jgi:DNA-binding transcriptional LysR family regulator